MTDKEKLDAVRAEIHRLVDVRGYDREIANDLFTFIDSLPNEPVSNINFEQELYKYFGQVKDFTLGMRIAKRFYEMGKRSNVQRTVKNWEEPVSEDFEKEVRKYAPIYYKDNDISKLARHFANWQKEQDNQYFAKKTIETLDEVFEDGRDNMKQQMIAKACKYLQDHREEVDTEDNGISGWISDELIEDFENYMKG